MMNLLGANPPPRPWTSQQRYEYDQRFRMLVQSVVHEAMRPYIERNPEADFREAHDLATTAAALMMERLYKDDAELTAQRAMAERYREIAEGSILAFNRPPPLTDPSGKL